MKLSINHGGICRAMGLEAGLRYLKEIGFDSIDYTFIEKGKQTVIFTEDFRQRIADTAALLKEIGLGCNETHSPIPVSYGPPTIHFGEALDESNPHFMDMVYTLEASALLGATQSVYHGLAVPDGGASDQYMEFNRAYFKALEPYAKEYGVKIGIENLEKISGNLYKVEWVDQLLDLLDSDQFYAHVDLGHAAASETTPDAFLRGLKRGRVKGLHFHDFNTQEAHVVPGLGVTDWDKVAVALAEIGYEGDLTMEVSTHMKFPRTLLPAALRFTAESGKIFIRKFEKAKENLTSNMPVEG